ncbi:YtxH domain-containing protein [Gracilibacillus oryzae]|uniref:YtxH domain-containing protein n=1 Tax=Gracilibacillus oryzae TaxID=1672701 RepID=A0A7C8KRK4_9BACI|nr:YtxH domain-containing protein [Gracilibacillus oryzae]KAB8138334.1 YtxH domain-containing protein [Gracilibacillus oryzae]
MTHQQNNYEENNQNINSKDFLIGSLIGGIVGASLALIFAPKSGKELRSDINHGAHYVKDRANEWKEVAYDKGNEWKGYAQEQSNQLGQVVSEKSQNLTNKLKETKTTIQDKMKGQQEPEEAAEEVARAIDDAAKAFDETDDDNVTNI